VIYRLRYLSSIGKRKEVAVPFIKLNKLNEAGEAVGTVFINTDQIVAVTAGQNTTEIQMTDGRARWIKENPEQIVALAKASE
jgi:hypothetical protein